jgi:hypothetical protein
MATCGTHSRANKASPLAIFPFILFGRAAAFRELGASLVLMSQAAGLALHSVRHPRAQGDSNPPMHTGVAAMMHYHDLTAPHNTPTFPS